MTKIENNMPFDPFAFLFKTFVLAFMGTGFFLSLVFTFAINTFLEWERQFESVDALSHRIMNPFQRQVQWYGEWLVCNHKVFGVSYMACALSEMMILFSLADKF